MGRQRNLGCPTPLTIENKGIFLWDILLAAVPEWCTLLSYFLDRFEYFVIICNNFVEMKADGCTSFS